MNRRWKYYLGSYNQQGSSKDCKERNGNFGSNKVKKKNKRNRKRNNNRHDKRNKRK